jgi:hypothetical protein
MSRARLHSKSEHRRREKLAPPSVG